MNQRKPRHRKDKPILTGVHILGVHRRHDARLGDDGGQHVAQGRLDPGLRSSKRKRCEALLPDKDSGLLVARAAWILGCIAQGEQCSVGLGGWARNAFTVARAAWVLG